MQTHPVTDRRALLGLLAGAVAVGLIWWSPSVGAGSVDDGVAATTSRPVDPSLDVARGLAAILIDHVGAPAVRDISGRATPRSAWANVYDADAGWGITITRDPNPDDNSDCRSRRNLVVACRLLADGSQARVTGFAFCGRLGDPALVEAIVTDPRLDGGATAALVQLGSTIEDFRVEKPDEFIGIAC
jgi:hypothetical protein